MCVVQREKWSLVIKKSSSSACAVVIFQFLQDGNRTLLVYFQHMYSAYIKYIKRAIRLFLWTSYIMCRIKIRQPSREEYEKNVIIIMTCNLISALEAGLPVLINFSDQISLLLSRNTHLAPNIDLKWQP